MKTTKEWYTDGFGLRVVEKLNKRWPTAYNGLMHLGGISTGTWITTPDAAGRKVRDILDMYASEGEFLSD